VNGNCFARRGQAVHRQPEPGKHPSQIPVVQGVDAHTELPGMIGGGLLQVLAKGKDRKASNWVRFIPSDGKKRDKRIWWGRLGRFPKKRHHPEPLFEDFAIPPKKKRPP
jgi:hypothetical protein